jgi:outer membrane receptor protein involved in Fe transport
MSYTLPQFLETAYFRNSFSTYSTIGNQNLIPVQNTNVDLKWEFFPTNGELISIGAFYKNMKDPIARSETGNNVMTYFNVGSSAMVTGAELEVKKNLFTTSTDHGDNILSGGLNLSYLYARQKLENPNAIFTKAGGESALQGASPVLVNADLSYLFHGRGWDWTSTVVLNYFSDRIYAIGTQGFNDVIEKGIPTLDFVTNANINKKWGVSLRVRNILDPEIRLEREPAHGENIVLESFKMGTDLTLGVSYRF